MKKKTVRIVALLIAAALLLGIVAGIIIELVYAETDEEKLERMEQEKSDAQEQLEETQLEKEKTLEVMEGLEKEVADIQMQIDDLNSQIADTEESLADEEVKLADATEKATTQYDVFKERFRIMCEQGDVGFVEMLLSANDFNSLIDKMEAMKEISEYDKDIFDQMEQNRQDIEDARDAIAELKTTLEESKSSLDTQMEALVEKQKEQQEYMAELESDAEAYQQVIDDADAAMEAIREEQARKLSTEGSGGSGGGSPVYVGGDFAWPTPSCYYITSSFSPWRKNPVTGIYKRHTGTDIGAAYGAQIVAANSGTVTLAGWNSGYGYCVIIDHGGGKATLYAHMSSFVVSAGQTVSKGQHIGNVGSTGNSTGPHLHFEVLINGEAVDPMQFFS